MIHFSNKQLRDYQFDLLEDVESASIAAHLETCEECRAGLERIRQQFAALDVLEETPRISEDLLHRVLNLRQQQIQREVSGNSEMRRVMIAGKAAWKAAAALAIIVCTGAIATTVGLKIYNYHFDGKGRDGKYFFSSEPIATYEAPADTNGFTSSAGVYAHTIWTDDSTNGSTITSEAEKVEQMQQELAEIDYLRQLNERELTRVSDLWVNGHFQRTCHFRYKLADGRFVTIGEGDPDVEIEPAPEQFKRDMDEIALLRDLGQRELVGIIESDVDGKIFRTCEYEYTLSDGRAVPVGEGDPDPDTQTPVLTPEQDKEVWHLRRLEQGEYLGDLEREINGQIFVCETYIFTLEDGTVVTHAMGGPKNRKTSLTAAEWEEFGSLRKSEAGELLDITEREVQGQMFRFERRRYILSDGVEVILAVGKHLDSK